MGFVSPETRANFSTSALVITLDVSYDDKWERRMGSERDDSLNAFVNNDISTDD
jgi:hypothetical protein